MRAVLWALAAAALLAAPVQGQIPTERISVELRGGASAGNYAGAASDFEVLPGAAVGAAVSYAATERLSVYAGYTRGSFGCDTGFCADRDVTLTSHGMEAGVRYGFASVALPRLSVAPWVSLGLVDHSLAVDVDEVPGRDDANGFGFSAGAGMELPVRPRLSLTPGIRYVRYGAADDDGVAMLVADVGLRIRM
jgi:hypothetical protein